MLPGQIHISRLQVTKAFGITSTLIRLRFNVFPALTHPCQAQVSIHEHDSTTSTFLSVKLLNTICCIAQMLPGQVHISRLQVTKAFGVMSTLIRLRFNVFPALTHPCQAQVSIHEHDSTTSTFLSVKLLNTICCIAQMLPGQVHISRLQVTKAFGVMSTLIRLRFNIFPALTHPCQA